MTADLPNDPEAMARPRRSPIPTTPALPGLDPARAALTAGRAAAALEQAGVPAGDAVEACTVVSTTHSTTHSSIVSGAMGTSAPGSPQQPSTGGMVNVPMTGGVPMPGGFPPIGGGSYPGVSQPVPGSTWLPVPDSTWVSDSSLSTVGPRGVERAVDAAVDRMLAVMRAAAPVRGKAVELLARHLRRAGRCADMVTAVELAMDLLAVEEDAMLETLAVLIDDGWEGSTGELLACARGL